jgi:ParB family chromosome partitioning protein
MTEIRRGLGRGLGALIPTSGTAVAERPVDVFFRQDGAAGAGAPDTNPREPGTPTAGTSQGGTAEAETPGAGASGEATGRATPASEDLLPVPGVTFAEIPLDLIRPNPRQPRTVFDEDELAELVHSIREIGVLQPVVVRPVARRAGTADGDDADGRDDDGTRYELVMGERRWRASREAGRDTVPALVKETEHDDLLRDALLENLHRSQLNALEEAAAYQQLLDDFGCTQEELARRIGRSRPQVSNTLRLLRLPPPVARRVAAGVISAGHARALLALEDGAAMERLAQRVVAEGLSVRSVEEVVALGEEPARAARRRPRPGARRPQLDDLAAELSDRLDTRVSVALGQRRGRLTVEFASMEDLGRILDVMGLQRAGGDPRGSAGDGGGHDGQPHDGRPDYGQGHDGQSHDGQGYDG